MNTRFWFKKINCAKMGLSFVILLTTQLPLSHADNNGSTDFGKPHALQWIIDTNHDGIPDVRRNFGGTRDMPLAAGDYTGDGADDFAVVRIVDGKLQWIINNGSHDGVWGRFTFGLDTDTPVPGDYNGDGRVDLAVVRITNGNLEWIIDTDFNAIPNIRVIFGTSNDTPVPEDFDGDGRMDLAVNRVIGTDRWWKVDTNLNGTTNIDVQFGTATDSPIPADYNGDGAADFGVLRDLGNQLEWIVDTNRNGTDNFRVTYGLDGDIPIPADYNGDGATDLAVLRIDEGQTEWLVDINRNGTTDLRKFYGKSTDMPVPGDYNGDGQDEFAVARVVEYVDGSCYSGLEAAVKTLVLRHLDTYSVPGASVAITKNGKIICEQGFGYKSVETRIPTQAHDIFRIGSISKLITMLGFMKLTEQNSSISEESFVYGNNGLLNHPRYLNHINEAIDEGISDASVEQCLTIQARHLLSHSARFGNKERNFESNATTRWKVSSFDDLSYWQVHSHFLATTPLFDMPGESSKYENQNLGVFDLIISTNAGVDYKSYIQNELLAPLRLKDKILPFDDEFAGDWRETGYHVYASIPYGEDTDTPIIGDYNGDGHTDFAVIRNIGTKKHWRIDTNLDGVTNISTQYGTASDMAVMGDYNGDGVSDRAIVRIDGRKLRWLIDTNADGVPDINVFFGEDGDVPVPADYDGDGDTDLAVMRADGTSRWWKIDINKDGRADLDVEFGLWSDIPMPADYDGDGAVDFAIARPSENGLAWRIDTNRDGTADISLTYGKSTDIPDTADLNGDGASDIAVRRVDSNGVLEWLADVDKDGRTDRRQKFGNENRRPFFADFNGNGAADIALTYTKDGVLYWQADTLLKEVDVEVTNSLGLAAGSWLSSAGNFARLLLATDQLDNHSDILNLETMQTIETSVTSSYALAWSRDNDGKLSHNGALTGGFGRVVKYPDNYREDGETINGDIIVVVFLNLNDGEGITNLTKELAIAASRIEVPASVDLY